MSESLTLYKLIVLFMLHKVTFPLTNSQISGFMLEKEYTSYFTLQQTFSELIDSNLIECKTIRNQTLYHLTEEGKKTLEYFGDKISNAIKEDVLSYLSEKKYELRNEVSITSDFYKTNNSEYAVHCQAKEGDTTLIDLTVTAATERQAALMADNWTTANQKIYALIMEQLLHEGENSGVK